MATGASGATRTCVDSEAVVAGVLASVALPRSLCSDQIRLQIRSVSPAMPYVKPAVANAAPLLIKQIAAETAHLIATEGANILSLAQGQQQQQLQAPAHRVRCSCGASEGICIAAIAAAIGPGRLRAMRREHWSDAQQLLWAC